MPALTPMPGPSPGPKKETARITVLPDPPVKSTPTVQMKKTQPLINMPAPRTEKAPITVAPPAPSAIVDSIPMPLCWTLLALSAVVLIIQIWGYFV
jgi:hypothetical protein